MFICLAIVCTVQFSVNGPVHNVHFCMCMLPQMCGHVVFATVSEDFTVFHTLASQVLCVCVAFLPCDCSTLSEQDTSQLLAHNVLRTMCHTGLAFLMQFTMTSSPFGCTDMKLNVCKAASCKVTGVLSCVYLESCL